MSGEKRRGKAEGKEGVGERVRENREVRERAWWGEVET